MRSIWSLARLTRPFQRDGAPHVLLYRTCSASPRDQENYTKSIVQAFLRPNEDQSDVQAEIDEVIPAAQSIQQKRLISSGRMLQKELPEKSTKVEVSWPLTTTGRDSPVPILNTNPARIELPKSDVPLGIYENPEEGPVPISSIVNKDQTITESVQLVEKWFRELDLNTLTVPVFEAGNLAPYVPRSHTLQQLVLLGVDLSKVEAIPGAANMLIKMDFHRSIEPMIWKLNDLGFDLKQIARILTRFPKVLKLSLDELTSRFTYFVQRGFTQTETVELIVAQPLVLECSSVEIDRHLGHVQTLFGFSAVALRSIVNTVPAVLLHPLGKIKDTYVLVTKMFGYEHSACRTLACDHPKLLVTERDRLVANFAFMHTQLDLPLDIIQMWPDALTAAPHLLPERASFLVRRKLFQPDPKKPLYTPLSAVVSCTDKEFCDQFGRTTEEDYNIFLKTL